MISIRENAQAIGKINGTIGKIETNVQNIHDAMLDHFDDDKDSFETLQQSDKDIMRMLGELQRSIELQRNDSKGVNEWFRDYSSGKKLMLSLLGVVGALLAIGVGIKNLFRL